MSPVDNKALVCRYIEAVNTGVTEGLDELIAEGYVDWRPDRPAARVSDREWLKHYFQGLRSAFPDLRITIEDVITEGDKVVVRWTGRGTHHGEMFGLPPTHRQAIWSGVSIQRVADGKIAETWLYADEVGLRQHLSGHA